jgi:hypothetical protein
MTIIYEKICFFVCFALSGYAQNDEDALRFSRTYHLGTARFSAMGGAFTALGGDLTSLAHNPAGVGVYRSGEIAFTSNLNLTSVSSSYMGNKLDDSRYLMGVPNIGGVGVINIGGDDGFVSMNFGVSYNKLNNFSERLAVRGKPVTVDGTYLDYFASVANNSGITITDGRLNFNDFEAKMAYDTYLIDFDTSTNRCLSRFDPFDPNDQTEGRRSSEAWGSIGEFDFSLGGNIAHVLYFGITVGVQTVSYSQNVTDIEEGLGTNISLFEGFTYKREYRMSGKGTNFKAGLIARPFANADFLEGLRLGAAIHTPTFLVMSDRYDASLSSSFVDGSPDPAHLSKGPYEYSIETPLKLMGGVAYTFGDHSSLWRGIVSADCEYVDYTKMKMRNGSDGDDFFTENQDIANSYRNVANLRFGAELSYDNTAVRAGFATYGNPYESNIKKNGSVNFYSLGVGHRTRMFFVDFAYSIAVQKDKSYMYNSELPSGEIDVASGEISYDILQSNLMLTLGLRF